MNWLLSIITLIAFILLSSYLWRKISHAVWLAEEYSEFCYHLEMWVRDGEQGMGWANTVYQHQFGLCSNWYRYVWDKYPHVHQKKIRIELIEYQQNVLFKDQTYPFGDEYEYQYSRNKYTNPKRLAHIYKHARRFA